MICGKMRLNDKGVDHMKRIKAGAALMAVTMIAGIFSGCTKTANVTTEKFAQICDKMGLTEFDFEDEMPSGKQVEKGYYLVAGEDDAEDYLKDYLGEQLDEFSKTYGFEGAIDSNTVKSFAFAAKCEGYTDSKKDINDGDLEHLDVDGAFALQITLDGNYAEDIIKTIEDNLAEFKISYDVFSQKEFYYSKDEGHFRIHLDIEKTVDAMLDNPNIKDAGKEIFSPDMMKQFRKLRGDAAVAVEINGPDVLIVGGGSVHNDPKVLKDFVKAFGLAQDPLALPVNDRFVDGAVRYVTDLAIMYLRSLDQTQPVPDPGTDPDTDPTAETTAEPTASADTVKIGISMPTKDLQRWNQDGDLMRKGLINEGYEVDLQYASNSTDVQARQINNMIETGCRVIIVAAIAPDTLNQVLKNAKDKGVTVIAYDRLITNTDAVDYYVSFDNYLVGQLQGMYIEASLDLGIPEGLYTMEITSGDTADINGRYMYNGAMDVLRPYIDSGKLQIKSGQIDYDVTSTEAWATDKARGRAEYIAGKFYSGSTTLDAWLCLNDSTALGVALGLESAYTGKYPIITGLDCNIENVKNIINGKQAMSVFKDTRTLVERTVKMTSQIVEGKTVEVNDTQTYDNGVKVVPSYLCAPIVVTIDNYKTILIDSGYYTADQLGV